MTKPQPPLSKKPKKPDGSSATYERDGDGAIMVEIEPGWFVSVEVWAKLQRAGVTSCTKKQED